MTTVTSNMEVPRRPQPSTFTLPLHSTASARLEEVDPRRSEPQEEEEDEEGEERDPASERPVPVIVEPPELEVTDAMAGVSLEDRRRSEEEEEAARERAAQRQQLAVEELVQSERNFLRHLQLTTVTIRSNLQKLQVLTQRREKLLRRPTRPTLVSEWGHQPIVMSQVVDFFKELKDGLIFLSRPFT